MVCAKLWQRRLDGFPGDRRHGIRLGSGSPAGVERVQGFQGGSGIGADQHLRDAPAEQTLDAAYALVHGPAAPGLGDRARRVFPAAVDHRLADLIQKQRGKVVGRQLAVAEFQQAGHGGQMGDFCRVASVVLPGVTEVAGSKLVDGADGDRGSGGMCGLGSLLDADLLAQAVVGGQGFGGTVFAGQVDVLALVSDTGLAGGVAGVFRRVVGGHGMFLQAGR